MSRNNKNARRTAERKAWSAQHKSGSKGPARTTPKKHKKFSYRNPSDKLSKDRQEKINAILGKTRSKSVIEDLKSGRQKQPKAVSLLKSEEVLEVLEIVEDAAIEAIVPHKPHGGKIDD